uniref:RING-type domain-containing protein n=1 Tax=Hyaloperonospora arabidopsidis (strain Emoy2) TaxID=559515 RepID=M4BB06_HYAAE
MNLSSANTTSSGMRSATCPRGRRPAGDSGRSVAIALKKRRKRLVEQRRNIMCDKQQAQWKTKTCGLWRVNSRAKEGALEESSLYNLRKSPTTLNEVEELLRKLIAEKWLAPSNVQLQTRSLTLGPRAYLELIAFLRDLQVKKCPICQYELLQGAKCHNKDCDTTVHRECIDKFENRGVLYKCPACRVPFQR